MDPTPNNKISTMATPGGEMVFVSDMGGAISALRHGYKIAREGWNGKGMFLSLQVPDENSKMKRPYIYITPDADHVVPWVASQADLLATDWYIVA